MKGQSWGVTSSNQPYVYTRILALVVPIEAEIEANKVSMYRLYRS